MLLQIAFEFGASFQRTANNLLSLYNEYNNKFMDGLCSLLLLFV